MPLLPPVQLAEVGLWLGLLIGAGWLMAPLARMLLPGQGDDGRLTGKLLGWAIAGTLPWLASALHLADFARHGPLIATTGLFAIHLATRDRAPTPTHGWRAAPGSEALFALLFLLGLAQRLGAPDLNTLEKFTDMGFLASAMRSADMPPPDAWFAGEAINYYYVGHAITALWGNLAAMPPDHAYQLGMATLFALTGAMAFHLVRALVMPRGSRLASACGAFAAMLVLWGGNGHAVVYQFGRFLVPVTKDAYRYPDSTRYIGYDPPTDDKAFTEFPAYGFYVGDLHAHLLATPLALFGLVVLLAMLRAGWDGRTRVPLGTAALVGAVLGLSVGVNSWDLAVTGLVALLVWLLLLARQRGPWPQRLARLLVPTAVVALTTAALAAPFLASFQPFAEGIRPVLQRTPAWQLLVVYWPGIPALLALPPLLARRALPPEPAFVAVMALTVLALIALPEVFYVKDIYGADFARANTMFKLSFRGQAMLQLAGAAVAGWWLTRRGAVVALIVALPLASELIYARDTFRLPPRALTLDGTRFLGDEAPLAAAVAALPLAPGEAILEAPGTSFTATSRISAMTGQPAVIGWVAHEWLWRGDREAPAARAAETSAFYTTMTQAERCAFIARHRIRAILVAREEAEKFPALDRAGLDRLGPAIATSPAGKVIAPDPAACPE